MTLNDLLLNLTGRWVVKLILHRTDEIMQTVDTPDEIINRYSNVMSLKLTNDNVKISFYPVGFCEIVIYLNN